MATANGWRLYVDPVMRAQLDRLAASVARAKAQDPAGWQHKTDARLFDMIVELMLVRIPHDPLAPIYRQGGTLGPARRHWFRAKFGGNRFRLFFRCDSTAKVIVYAWVNDRDTLRKAGSASDPYAVFSAMLARGKPPDDWPALLAAAEDWP